MLIILDARTASDHFPGIGRYVVNLARALTNVAPDQGIALLHDPTASTARLALPANPPRIACTVSPFSIRQQWMVPRLLRQTRAALYHSPYYLMPYRPGVPMLLTCYDLIPLVCPEYYTFGQRIIFYLAQILALKAAHTILATSEATRSDLVCHLHVDARRIVVTPLAADAHFVPQSRDAITAARVKYGLPEQYVLYLGSNKPHKNLPQLVRAFAQSEINNQKLKIHLVIAGPWDTRYPEAKKIAASGATDRVLFLGAVDDADLPALYSGAIVFVFPSLYEGFGLPVLEAMACGAPVVCGNTSSLPEVVGDAGLLFNPHNANDIAATIQHVIDDPELRSDMRQRGLARAAQFTWERTAQQTLAVYRAVLAAT